MDNLPGAVSAPCTAHAPSVGCVHRSTATVAHTGGETAAAAVAPAVAVAVTADELPGMEACGGRAGGGCVGRHTVGGCERGTACIPLCCC